MSFSKAKIQRFNDINDCSPSPAKYNTVQAAKAKYGIIPQAERFTKMESPSHSDNGSLHSTPCFPAPSVLPKKKKIFGFSTSKSKTVDLEELKDKIVECKNKDIYIKELIEQMEEMKDKASQLEQVKVGLESENTSLVQKVENLAEECQTLQCTYSKSLNMINEEIRSVKTDLKQTRRIYQQTKAENIRELAKISSYINQFYNLHVNLVEALQQEIALKDKKLEENDAKIKQLEENFQDVHLLAEIQTKEKLTEVESSWKLKLEDQQKQADDILKECQAISEYSIIQCEIEKNQYKNLLFEKEREFEDLKTEKRAYELSINTYQDTIEVLKKRLINSDHDVEQLKEELSLNEAKTLELINQIEEKEALNEELEMQIESTVQMVTAEVKNVQKELTEKVESLEKQTRDLCMRTEDAEQLVFENNEITIEARELVDSSRAAIERLEVENQEFEHRIVSLELELRDAQMSLEGEIMEGAEIRKKYIEKSGKYDQLSQQFEQLLQELDMTKGRNHELEETIAGLQNLIGPFQEQLEGYDLELKILKKEKEDITTEANELNMKYADILGHHNHSQKIKHVSDLKKKMTDLQQVNLDLAKKNTKLDKQIEKLKKELEDVRKPTKKVKQYAEDKENLLSPARGAVRVESPLPLKEKN